MQKYKCENNLMLIHTMIKIDLITFYKQKVSDTEFNFLQSQLRFNKSVAIINELKELVRMYEEKIKNLTDSQTPELVNPKSKNRNTKS
jgi:hypothetical protein